MTSSPRPARTRLVPSLLVVALILSSCGDEGSKERAQQPTAASVEAVLSGGAGTTPSMVELIEDSLPNQMRRWGFDGAVVPYLPIESAPGPPEALPEPLTVRASAGEVRNGTAYRESGGPEEGAVDSKETAWDDADADWRTVLMEIEVSHWLGDSERPDLVVEVNEEMAPALADVSDAVWWLYRYGEESWSVAAVWPIGQDGKLDFGHRTGLGRRIETISQLIEFAEGPGEIVTLDPADRSQGPVVLDREARQRDSATTDAPPDQ